jgi:hypothetical protein
MAITSIVRDLTAPNIVRVASSDTLATVAGAGYLTAQIANTTALNHGLWEWVVGDMVEVAASDGSEFFRFSGSDFTTLIQLPGGNGAVTLPVVSGNFTVFDGTLGALKDLGYLPSNAAKTKVVMAGSAVVANHIALFQDTSGTVDDTAATAINNGSIQAGLSGTAGTLISYPAVAANGNLIIAAVGNAGNFSATVSSKSTLGQATVYTIPDPGAATANFILDAGTAAALSVNNLKYGATPVAQVDPGSCTITAAAGAANTSTVTIQLKDGSGANIAYISPFRVYASSASNGLTLASAASTGFSVASGGLSLANGTAVTTQINGVTSATGGCVLSLLDTGKQTSYLVLVLHNGVKISAQLSAGSYG